MSSQDKAAFFIQNKFRECIKRLKALPAVEYRISKKKSIWITYEMINAFANKNRSKNDENNKMREYIIVCVINNTIPNEYYKYSLRWSMIKEGLDSSIKELCRISAIDLCNDVSCKLKGGRLHHYDFEITINKHKVFNIEFKYNAKCISDVPQFVSPMNPSRFLDASYEEYYYDNYLNKILTDFNLEKPSRDVYLKEIHSNSPKCMRKLQNMYYRGCSRSSKFAGNQEDIHFYNTMKLLANESIVNFITEYGIKKDKLSHYLLDTQKDIHYMLYQNGSFVIDSMTIDDYMIIEISKDPNFKRYKAKTKNGKELNILLRWKNGNGIAYPSFQIS
jgi:hypothetical protein